MKKFLMLLLIVILATACAPTTSTSTTSLPTSISPTLQPAPTLQPTPTERESTLIVAFSRDPTTLDPAVYYEFEGQMVIDAVYEQLVTYMEDENGKLTIVPKLAERWDVSSDYKEYTFYLRKGVKFHDGEPYNAEAQKLAYERMASINAGPAFMISAYVDTMEVVDEYTLKISLNGSYPEYLDILAGFWCPSRAVSPKAVTDHTVDGDFAADWFRENAVGTGPYKLESWTHGQQIVLVKNEDYWGGVGRFTL